MSIGLVMWWCSVIGVTDHESIQVAAGVFAGGSLLFIGFLILTVVVGGLLSIGR